LPQFEPRPRPFRTLQLTLFVASLSWVVAATALAAHAARGFAIRFQSSDGFPLLDGIFLVFLLIVGFALLEVVASRNLPHQPTLRQTIGLPRRPTARTEFATGVAIGWAVILVSVFTMALAGTLHVRFWLELRSLELVLLNLATVAAFALASEIAFRGYPYRRLIEAIGPTSATLVMSVLFALITTFNQDSTWLSTLIAVLLGFLLATAWLRTHGLWVGWGLHFAWIASLGVLFGLPVNGFDNLSSIVQTRTIGRFWITGGDFGPEGALLTPLLLVAAIVLMMRATRDWSWHYTYTPIVSGGHPMDVAPPAAHAAMEAKPAAAPALVQILPTTPQTRSVEPETH
jgi:membrane protease YdiL (CAAX protease family)